MKSAIKSKASDIHVEPMEKGVLIRHRLDGLLKEVMDLPKWVHEGLIARLKIMAGMDIAEKRLPQDGRLRSTAEDGTEVDFRVSTLRTLYGEKVVMRVLDHRKGVPAIEEIGPKVEIVVTPTDDHRSYHVSSERIRRDLGFLARRSVETAIVDLRDAFAAGKVPHAMTDDRYYNIKRMQALRLR